MELLVVFVLSLLVVFVLNQGLGTFTGPYQRY